MADDSCISGFTDQLTGKKYRKKFKPSAVDIESQPSAQPKVDDLLTITQDSANAGDSGAAIL